MNCANGIERDGRETCCEDCMFYLTEEMIKISYIKDAEDSIDSFIMFF
jgi:hypothetical protein